MHIKQTASESLNEQQCSHEHVPVNRPTIKMKQLREKAIMKKVTQSLTHTPFPWYREKNKQTNKIIAMITLS